MADLPQEAIEAAAHVMGRKSGSLNEPVEMEDWLTDMRDALAAAVPFLRQQWEQALLSDDMVELVAQTIADMTGVAHVGPGEHWALADARTILEAIVAAKEKGT